MTVLTTLDGGLRLDGGSLVLSSDDDTPCCCGCCHVGDGRGGIFVAGRGGGTCWSEGNNNVHIFFSQCESDSVVIKGIGLIGTNDDATIQQNVRYAGNLVVIKQDQPCPTTAVIRTNRLDCISLTAVGTRNTGNGQNWTHPANGVLIPAACGAKTPGSPIGGQGAYTLTISNIDPEGAFEVHLILGCNTAAPGINPLFTVAPNGAANGTFFYVAGDNQLNNSTLNNNPALGCPGDGSMIEARVVPNTVSPVVWGVSDDCIVSLLEGWVVPAN